MTIETLFQEIDQIASQSDIYLEGISHACYQLLEREEVQKVPTEERRRAVQLAVVKGMKEGVQRNHQMTPEVIGLLTGYMIHQLMGEEKNTIVDVGVGSGQYLYSVLAQLPKEHFEAIGIEIDDVLIQLAAATGEFIKQPVHYYMQDALTPWKVEKAKFVIGDLPIGYYPMEENEGNFILFPKEGLAYSHYLLIEQSVRHLTEDGYAFFVVPNDLFSSEQSDALHEYLQREAVLRAVLPLPEEMVKKESDARSIIILQRRTEDRAYEKEVLVSPMPSFDQVTHMQAYLRQLDGWLQEEMKE